MKPAIHGYLFFLFLVLTTAPHCHADSTRYAIQIGACRTMEHARTMLTSLEGEGYPGRVVTVDSGPDAPWFKIIVGSFATYDDAREFETVFRQQTDRDMFIARFTSMPEVPEVNSMFADVPKQEIGPLVPPVETDIPLVSGSELLKPLGERERLLALARMQARRGDLPEALRLYSDLKHTYPNDSEVLSDLAETLTEAGKFEAARGVLDPWIARQPGSPEPLRELGRWLLRTGKPDDAARVFDRIAEMTPEDTRAFADAGYAHLEAGEWDEALEFFSRVLDHDPQNLDVSNALREILAEHRPRLETGFRYTTQSEGQGVRELSSSWNTPMGTGTRLALSISNLETMHTENRDTIRTGMDVSLQHALKRKLLARGGLGYTENLGLSPRLGMTLDLDRRGSLSADLEFNTPWISDIEAPGLDGTYRQARLGYERPLGKWYIGSNLWRTDYLLDKTSRYAEEHGLEISLVRNLHNHPGLDFFYVFRRTWLSYAQSSERPITMTDEAGHTAGFRFSHRLSPRLEYGTGVGIGLNEFQDGPTFIVDPSLIIRLGPRFRLETRYSFVSSSPGREGQTTHTVDSSLQILF
ncbi:MAG TPA: tetratricopeptide repeat protein [Desulfomicrobiaceae bacterium]|nr:tetratricopeptide repeat protein [Desulfomicrobiaceae bacterium]